ncbi:hypothetical protein PQX77_003316 [Marasmius sp. AFHP31]|nr:hypothetical protein PQX77_003316 [Marasmius sp. AFHP31]
MRYTKNADVEPQARAQVRDPKSVVRQQVRTIRDRKAGELANLAKVALHMWTVLPWIFDLDEEEEERVKVVLEAVFGKIVEMEVSAEKKGKKKLDEDSRKIMTAIEECYNGLKELKKVPGKKGERLNMMDDQEGEFEEQFEAQRAVLLGENVSPIEEGSTSHKTSVFPNHSDFSHVEGERITSSPSSSRSQTTVSNTYGGEQNFNRGPNTDMVTGNGVHVSNSRSSRSLSIFSDPPPPYEESDPANRVLDVLSGPVCEEPTSTLSDDPPNPFSDYHRAQSHSRGSTNSAHRSSTSTFFAGVEGLTIGDTYYHRIGPNGIELTPHPGRDQVNGSASGHPSSGSTISNYNAPGAGVQSNYQGSGVSNVNWGRNQNVKEGPK